MLDTRLYLLLVAGIQGYAKEQLPSCSELGLSLLSGLLRNRAALFHPVLLALGKTCV